ncbi:S1C family serine protease [Sulfuriroseicoccus oceanibius]|uniref:PDZ domain-containing protein n=1 Tax=Sulfuriroseicoccus oceanibius TaxID=2707525 RepID=A0A6B3L1W0_9BACT|nr:PDZ domain-containing protein [Sulfuriroseicoccus oceanibius]QQL43687.1 PDZ domain-containing protein [Sulfuriroseicoccus oceanibius]
MISFTFRLALAVAALVIVLPAAVRAQEITAASPSPATSTCWVTATEQEFNILQPWEKKQPRRKRGIGALIHGNRLLVSADLIANSTFIELERPTDGAKTTAKVVGRDYEANLAVVQPVESPDNFLEGMVPLAIDERLAVGHSLTTWQLEKEGTPVLTTGIVNRAEVNTYALSHRRFLRFNVRISLENKTGGFSLPLVRDGKLAGILLSFTADEQVARIIPGPVISHFLTDLDDGDYQGFPSLGVGYAETTDETFRKYLGLNGTKGGIYITKVATNTPADKAGLKEGDVLVSIDGKAIDRRGNYDSDRYGKLSFSHLISSRYVGDSVELDILRDGKHMTVNATVTRKAPHNYVIDPFIYDRGPNYLMLGGLLLQELSRDYITSFRDWRDNAPIELQAAMANTDELEQGTATGRKFVFLSYTIPTPATVGYEEMRGLPVESINGKPILRMEDVAAALNSPVDGVHHIVFSGNRPDAYIDADLADRVNDHLKQSGMALQRIVR